MQLKSGPVTKHKQPYTEHEDQLILNCPYGGMKNLADRLGRNAKSLASRKAKLLSGEIPTPVHYNTQRNEKIRAAMCSPFARPDWFEEDIQRMSVIGTSQKKATMIHKHRVLG